MLDRADSEGGLNINAIGSKNTRMLRGTPLFSDGEEYSNRNSRNYPIELEEGSSSEGQYRHNSARLSPPKVTDSVRFSSRASSPNIMYDSSFNNRSNNDVSPQRRSFINFFLCFLFKIYHCID
jgi:glycosidase